MPPTLEEIEGRLKELEESNTKLEQLLRPGGTDSRIPLLATGFDIEDAVFPPAVLAYHSAAITIPNSSATILDNNLNSERFDTDGMHSTSSGTKGRLIAVTAGIYSVSANIEWAANTTGVRALDIMINGATVIASVSEHEPNAGNALAMSVTTTYELGIGDYFVMKVFQNSGGDLSILQSSNYSPVLSAVWVAPAL